MMMQVQGFSMYWKMMINKETSRMRKHQFQGDFYKVSTLDGVLLSPVPTTLICPFQISVGQHSYFNILMLSVIIAFFVYLDSCHPLNPASMKSNTFFIPFRSYLYASNNPATIAFRCPSLLSCDAMMTSAPFHQDLWASFVDRR